MMKQSTHSVAAQTELNGNRHHLPTLQVDQKFLHAEDTITVANYILSRLVETGVTVRLDLRNTPPCFTNALV